MDGVRLIHFLLLFVCVVAQASEKKHAPHCAWSTSNPQANSKLLKIQIQKFQSINQSLASCPLSETFDESTRSLRLGALQALAISKQSCDVSKASEVDESDFLFQALRLQGFRIAENPSYILKKIDTDPNYLFQSSGADCFSTVGSDVNNPDDKIKTGDLLVSKNELMVVDQISDDPFGIKAKLDDNKKILEFIAQGLDTPEHMCNEWMSDPTQFKLSVLSHVGRSPIFPRFGTTSSVWVTALTERANRECVKAVVNTLPPMQARKLASEPQKPATSVGVRALRFRSDVPACRVNHNKIPNFKDLDCVQFCDFDNEAKP